MTWGDVLFSGTREDAARAQAQASPAHTWPEAANPANQWLVNLRGAKAHRARVHNAGVEARMAVRKAYRLAGYPLPPYARHKDFRG